jgi:hypothetical protein
VAVLCAAGLAYAHGSRIKDNWHVAQWEDAMFFRYNSEKVHSLLDCVDKNGAWPLSSYYHQPLLLHILRNIRGPGRAIPRRQPPARDPERIALLSIRGVFTLLSVDLFVRCRQTGNVKTLACSALAFCLALLSKESAVVVPAVLIVYGWLFDDSIFRREYLVHPTITILWAALFALVLTRGQSNGFLYDFSFFNVLRNYGAYFLDFSNWVLTPLDDSIMPARVAAFAGTWFGRSAFGVLVVIELALLLFQRRLKSETLRIVMFGFAWFLITTLPFAIFQGRLFMRYSYLGHAGLALCAGAVLRAPFSNLVRGLRAPTVSWQS